MVSSGIKRVSTCRHSNIPNIASRHGCQKKLVKLVEIERLFGGSWRNVNKSTIKHQNGRTWSLHNCSNAPFVVMQAYGKISIVPCWQSCPQHWKLLSLPPSPRSGVWKSSLTHCRFMDPCCSNPILITSISAFTFTYKTSTRFLSSPSSAQLSVPSACLSSMGSRTFRRSWTLSNV